MELIIVLLPLALLAGAVLGWVAFFRVRALKEQVSSVQRQLDFLMRRLEASESMKRQIADPNSVIPPTAVPQSPEKEPERDVVDARAKQSPALTQEVWLGGSEEAEDREDTVARKAPGTVPAEIQAPATPDMLARLQEQWMIWLGGISVGLSGIFMVRYSIEQQLLGPMARIVLSLLAGLILHGVAEWGRRRSLEHYQALAALAGSASIILYAALLAALELYNLFPALVVFFALTLVSLATMALAIWHGPVLAILGILGAYVIPLLVDTGTENVANLYLYASIITAAALLLMRYVYRPWLWSGMLTGALAWLLITLDAETAYGIRGYYLAALAYLLLAVPSWDWWLRGQGTAAESVDGISRSESGLGLMAFLSMARFPKSMTEAPGLFTMALLLLIFGITLFAEQRVEAALFQWTPLITLLLIAAGRRPPMLIVVAGSLVVQMLAWLSLGLTTHDGIRLVGLPESAQSDFMIYAGWMAFLYTALSLRNMSQSPQRNFCCALAVAAPLLWLSLCYLLVSDLSGSMFWGVTALGLGLFYALLAAWKIQLDRRAPGVERSDTEPEYFEVWLILASHFAYSLSVAILFREAGLTLALSAQILSIALLIHRYNPPHLDLFLKGVLAVVVLRLTFNPWLLSYPTDIHWSLWTYGGATLFAGLGTWRLRENEKLGKWLEFATLHLLVLTLWAETRYYIYDGEIYRQQIDLLELSINTSLWSALSLVYYIRHSVSQSLKPLYLLASKILLVMGLGSYLVVLLPLNPYFTGDEISATPIFNILLLSYGLPAVIGALLYRFHSETWRPLTGGFAALASFIFINIEIRHLWSGELFYGSSTSSGELYTYTIVWLILAIACLLAGSIKYGSKVYRAGFGLMMVVIAKIFLLDMADLEGLLRVASFMGLGLSLLGLAYLYQRFNLMPEKSKDS